MTNQRKRTPVRRDGRRDAIAIEIDRHHRDLQAILVHTDVDGNAKRGNGGMRVSW